MRIIYSFNKVGYEAEQWAGEIAAASNGHHRFLPFNHGSFLDPKLYLHSYNLDCLYQRRDARLMTMYAALKDAIQSFHADAILVYHCPPYHPDFLKTLSVYKALFSGDDPDSTYKRNIPYLHAYDHSFFANPGYSADMTMKEKMSYCGMQNADWLPTALMDFEWDGAMTKETILKESRDIDLIYIGNCFPQKLGVLTQLKREFGRRFRIHGFYKLKHNLYLNVMHRYGGWISPVSFREKTELYKRAKVGVNIHWNEYGLGNARLYQLAANGVMQLCDCPTFLDTVYKTDEEIVGYFSVPDLIEKIYFYLRNDNIREAIAQRAFGRVIGEYRFGPVTRRAADLMEAAMLGRASITASGSAPVGS